jgi:hypothetical protein
MFTPANYGFGGRTSSAFYWVGAANNFVKYPNGGTFPVEAGWLSGITGPVALGSSNLPIRDVVRYMSPNRVTRFGPTPSILSTVFVGMWGKSKAVFPEGSAQTNTWQVFGIPANAT